MNTTTTDKTAEIADLNPQPYEVVRFNALKHGILSRYTVLSHESHADYESLVNSLMDEYLPAGATEQHLIEELATSAGRQDQKTAGLGGGHCSRRWRQAQSDALEDFLAVQGEARCAGTGELLRHWPQAGFLAQVARTMNLFRKNAFC